MCSNQLITGKNRFLVNDSNQNVNGNWNDFIKFSLGSKWVKMSIIRFEPMNLVQLDQYTISIRFITNVFAKYAFVSF